MCKRNFGKTCEKNVAQFPFKVRCVVREESMGVKRLGMCACLGDELLQPRWRVACCFGRGRKNGGYCNIHKGINFNNSAKRLTDWGSDRDSSSSQRHASLTVQQATRKSSQLPPAVSLRNKHCSSKVNLKRKGHFVFVANCYFFASREMRCNGQPRGPNSSPLVS